MAEYRELLMQSQANLEQESARWNAMMRWDVAELPRTPASAVAGIGHLHKAYQKFLGEASTDRRAAWRVDKLSKRPAGATRRMHVPMLP